MAAAFPLPVTASQVGSYFIGQYYQMLQSQPSFVHQFYSDTSTMIRVDGNMREAATDMLRIHQLVMSLNYTGIEIKTAHSLESWNHGVLVMVSGSVHLKDFNGRKKFMETFFLAPQQKGYFVLNDMFYYADEEQILQHPVSYLPKSNLESKLHSPATFREQVPDYLLGGDMHLREFQPTADIDNDTPLNNYNYPDEQIQQVPETEKFVDDSFVTQSNGSLQGTLNSVPDRFSSSMPEPVLEPPKHTYASIVAKAQSASVVSSQASFNKPAAPSEWQNVPETSSQSLVEPSNHIESSGIEVTDEALPIDDEDPHTVEVKSVYVRNVPTTMSASEIGEEFRKFGKLRPDGVAIRTRKDMDLCYAFVEFEDIFGVQNAIKASTVQIGGYQLYIEGRRPNRNNFIRGGRGGCRGRGRIGYSSDGSRGRLGGRILGRPSSEDGFERDYSRVPRSNGFYRPGQPFDKNGRTCPRETSRTIPNDSPL